jgi:hypothetical protein
MSVKVIGAEKAIHDTEAIAGRVRTLHEPLRSSFRLMESGEEVVFAQLAGRYVMTGTVRRSLTTPAGDSAVRQPIENGVKFGTSIWYARFLTQRIGPATPKGGMKRPPPSAVLRITEKVRADVLRELNTYVTDGTRL